MSLFGGYLFSGCNFFLEEVQTMILKALVHPWLFYLKPHFPATKLFLSTLGCWP